MKNYSTSKQLILNTKNFININYFSLFHNLFSTTGTFYGWGIKKSGLKAIKLAKKHNSDFVLLEDGFIRSLGLGVDDSPSFSVVKDDIGIYYDASCPSKLENILNTYSFTNDAELIKNAKNAIKLIKENNISKYNSSKDVDNSFIEKYSLNSTNDKVLIIAQTEGDLSLKYGMLENFTTDDMIDAAITENPNAKVYLKIHPDVLAGKKKSDINRESAKKRCVIIEENVNPLSLLKEFSKVYTKTSQMGFEALLVGCECVCFGMPFYAGWGITINKSVCQRRKRKLSVEEVFAAAYILYSEYHNPYTDRDTDIFDTIETIIKMRNL